MRLPNSTEHYLIHATALWRQIQSLLCGLAKHNSVVATMCICARNLSSCYHCGVQPRYIPGTELAIAYPSRRDGMRQLCHISRKSPVVSCRQFAAAFSICCLALDPSAHPHRPPSRQHSDHPLPAMRARCRSRSLKGHSSLKGLARTRSRNGQRALLDSNALSVRCQHRSTALGTSHIAQTLSLIHI